MAEKDQVSGCWQPRYHACSPKCHRRYNDLPPRLTTPFRSHSVAAQLEKLSGSW